MVDNSAEEEKNRREEEIKKKKKELRESEQKYGIISDIGNLLRIILSRG